MWDSNLTLPDWVENLRLAKSLLRAAYEFAQHHVAKLELVDGLVHMVFGAVRSIDDDLHLDDFVRAIESRSRSARGGVVGERSAAPHC